MTNMPFLFLFNDIPLRILESTVHRSHLVFSADEND